MRCSIECALLILGKGKHRKCFGGRSFGPHFTHIYFKAKNVHVLTHFEMLRGACCDPGRRES